MPRNSPFILKTVKYVLLTYAQVGDDFDPEWILDLCVSLEAECLVARERHADGGTHYHAFVEFGRLFSTRSSRRFDLYNYHPNIALVGRTPWVAYDYVCKDGDVVCGGAARPGPGGVPDPPKTNQVHQDWSYILDARDRDDFFVRLREKCPKSLATSFPSLCKYADWRWRRVTAGYTHPPELTFELDSVPEISDWVDDNTRGGVNRYVAYDIPGSSLKADRSAARPGEGILEVALTKLLSKTDESGPIWSDEDWEDFVGTVFDN